jgi:tripartite-type tricarboxylate transporter receptor subunit TctC
MSRMPVAVRIFSVGLIVLGAAEVAAQTYPGKPVRIITAAAGGSSDFLARIIAQGITDGLGQPVLVDNRTNLLAVEAVVKAAPDGYTLLCSSETMWIRTLLDKVTYDAVGDFLPISQVTREVGVVAVHPSLPVKSVKELIALAKARPGALNYGSGPRASGSHLAGALLVSMAGIDVVHVPFKGTAQSVTALMGGEVQLMVHNPAAVMSHVKSGRLRALAVTSAEPSALVPGLPAVAATGLPGYEAISMAGLFAPAKTPAAVINRLHQELARLAGRQDVKERLFNAGVEAVSSSPEQFATAIKADIARLAKVIKDAGIKAE